MKKVFLIALSCILFGSCKKNILDITPSDRISETAIWNDAVLPQLFVNAQYNALKSGFSDNIQYFGDEAYIRANEGNYQIIGKNTLTPSTVGDLSSYFNYYNTGYNAIRNFNIFFEKIEIAPVDATTKTKMIAEIKFLRAFVYAKLIWNYGGVPIIEKAFSIGDTFTGIKKSSYSECVAYILKDLNDAIANLPNQRSGAESGRASADAARALKSRLLLYYASPLNNPTNIKSRWQDASDAALELIGNRYSLYNNYHGLFIGENNSEAIFSKYYSTDVSHAIGFDSGPLGSGGRGQRAPSQNLVDAYEMTNGIIPFINGIRNPDPLNTYNPLKPYENRDPRFYATVLYNGAIFKDRPIQPYKGGTDFTGNDATPTGYYLYKFIDQTLPIAQTNPNTYPWHFFRLAEIYLNYAEAQYNLGNEDNARLYINKVRSRVGVGMPDVTQTGTALFTAIVHERQVELALEGHRFYDVRRWKIAPQTDALPIQGVAVGKETDGSFTYTRLNVLERQWNDKLYLIPFSLQEVRSSGGSLEQNPGYTN